MSLKYHIFYNVFGVCMTIGAFVTGACNHALVPIDPPAVRQTKPTPFYQDLPHAGEHDEALLDPAPVQDAGDEGVAAPRMLRNRGGW